LTAAQYFASIEPFTVHAQPLVGRPKTKEDVMLKRFTLSAWLVVVVLALWAGVSFASLVHSHTEYFSTATYLDTLWTTADWDTLAGEIRLHPFTLSEIGGWLGAVDAARFRVSGDLLLLADGAAGVHVIDVTNPASPTYLATCDTPGDAHDCVIEGDYVYVADGVSGLQVVDIMNTGIPFPAGSYNTPGQAMDVAVAGNVAYVADGNQGVKSIDVTTPTSPSLLGAYFLPGLALGVEVRGDYAYCACGAGGLRVIDVTDPSNLSEVGTAATAGTATDVAIAGDFAFVADGTSGLQVIDITDPTAPVGAGALATGGSAEAVWIDGNYAYVAAGAAGLVVVDVTDPTSPSLLDAYDTPGSAVGVLVAGEHAYVSDSPAGLRVIDIGEFVGPFPTSFVSGYEADGIDVDGDYAYVGVRTPDIGLVPVDISDPADPIPAPLVATSAYPKGVTVEGDYAYMAVGESGIDVASIADPTTPAIVETHGLNGDARVIAVEGDRAYVANWDGEYGSDGFVAVDVSNPLALTTVAHGSGSSIVDVAITGDYAYGVSSWDYGIIVYDVSTGAQYLGFEEVYDTAFSAEVHGDALFVAVYDGIWEFDITVPSSPTGDYAADADQPHGTDITGDRLYGAGEAGFSVVDIGPGGPVWIGDYFFDETIFEDVVIQGDHIFATADMSGEGLEGIHIMEIMERSLDITANEARSTDLEDSPYIVRKARLVASQSDSIRWELSADGGSTWEHVPRRGTWHTFATPGSSLLWRTTHEYAGGGVNPACTWVRIDWLYDGPAIDIVRDVPNDQGRQIRLSWTRSARDFLGDPVQVTEYAIYRRIDEWAAGKQERRPLEAGRAVPHGDWEFVSTVPATCEDTYTTIVPTLCDSTIAGGMCESTFFVRALTATPGGYFDSPPDSGYSVDNLAPAPPMNLMADGDEVLVTLDWDPCGDEDFDYFVVYRDTSGTFATKEIIGYTSDVTFDDDDPPFVEEWWYRVSAVDFSGNESEPSEPAGATPSTGVAEAEVTRFHLAPPVPNPASGSATVRYSVPGDAATATVTIDVFDSAGRLVRRLVDRPETSGSHTAVWDGRDATGNEAASGVYFFRMKAGTFLQSRKMTLLR
jgi:hypothetical protein